MPHPLPPPRSGPWLDARGRPLRDLRISVTDRCSFRCSYCMPKDVFDKDYAFLPHRDLLSFEEIARLARVFAQLGVEKLRLTGGEPLLRRSLEALIAQLAALRRRRGSRSTSRSPPAARCSPARPGAQGRRPGPRHRQPGRAGRRHLPAHERRGLPRRRSAARHRGRHAAGLAPIKVNMVSSAAPAMTRSSRWRAASAAPASCCASSSTWTSARATAGAWTKSCRPPGSSPGCGARRPGAARALLRRRDRHALGLRRRQRRDRPDLRRHAGLLRRPATARLSTEAASTCSSSPATATTCVRCCAASARAATTRSPPRSARIWTRRSDLYSELRAMPRGLSRSGPARRVEMHCIGG